MYIYELVVEDDREDHLAEHGVSVQEAEEVVFGQSLFTRSRDGRYQVVGQTASGRFLLVVIGRRTQPDVFGLITARDATDSERRLFRRHIHR